MPSIDPTNPDVGQPKDPEPSVLTSVANHGALWMTLALLAGLYSCSMRPGHDWGDDFSMYIQHALNLAQGETYGASAYVFNANYPVLGPQAYPPGYPLLLTLPAYWFGLDLQVFKTVTILAFLLGLAAMAWAFRTRLPLSTCIGIVLLFGLNPWVWQLKDSVVSDLPFLLPQFLALGLMARSEDKPLSVAQAVLLGICFAFATSMRTTGLLLPAAFFVAHLFHLRTLRMDALLSLAVFAGLFLIQRQLLPSGQGYLDQFQWAPLTFLSNFLAYGKSFSVLAAGIEIKALWLALSVFLFALVAIGFVRCVRQRISSWDVFFVIYFGLLVVWPDFGGARLLVPLLPMALYYAALGVTQLAKVFPALRHAGLALFLVLFLANLTWLVRHIDTGPPEQGIHTKESQELFAFVRRTPPDAVFAFQKPRALGLFTGRQTTAFHIPAEEQLLWDYFSRTGVGYLIESKDVFKDDSETYLSHLVRQSSDRLVLLFNNGAFRVYEVK